MDAKIPSDDKKNNMPERFLPLTWTAEMTLSHLADAGDKDAIALFERLGLSNEEIIDSPATMLSSEYRLTRTVFLNTRRRAMDAIAAVTGASLFVDLPCGMSPRGIAYAEKGLPYLGVDLPPVIERMEKAAYSLTEKEKRPYIKYAAADATDPDALLDAVAGNAERMLNTQGLSGRGELCVITEGLLMYLAEEETGRFCEGIARILSRFGGCWVSADPEMPLQMYLILRAVCGDSFSEVVKKDILRRPVTGRWLPDNPQWKSPLQIELRPDISGQIANGKAYLSQFGLKAERIPLSVFTERPILPEKLTSHQSEAVIDALKKVSCWVMTPDII